MVTYWLVVTDSSCDDLFIEDFYLYTFILFPFFGFILGECNGKEDLFWGTKHWNDNDDAYTTIIMII